MRAASKSQGVSKILVRPALWFCACNLLAAAMAAQCSNPTQVPSGTYTSGDHSQVDNNALSAANVVLSGSATATFVAGNCIQLLPGFHANAIGATVPTTIHAWVDLAPTAVSVSPTSGNGFSGPFTWTVSSPSGHSNLSHVFALFNTTSGSTANACYIHYDPSSNLLYLADNASATWSGGFVPGSSGSASNSQCSIYGNGASFSTSGTQLALTVPVTFQAPFSGTKNEYLLALDNSGLYTGWQQMGMWTVGPAGFTPIRISAGGAYTDSLGQVWSPDYGYLQSLGTWPTTAAISGTPDQRLYQTERYNAPSLTYQFSVPNGNYTVTLKFAEIYDTAPGQRYMNATLNGTTVFTYLDVWTAAGGPNRAYDLSYPVSVTNGQLTITLNCASPNNSAEVNAIQIVAGSAPQQYYLSTAVSPSGAGTVSPASGWYNSGSVVQVSANPAGGYVFSGFSGNLGGTTTPQYVTMNSSMSVTANFTQSATYYPLTTTVSPSGGGTISPTCPGGCSYSSGSQVTITATPASGYQFNGFTGSVNGSNPLTVTLNSAMAETATFTPIAAQYQLTTAVYPPGAGSITPACGSGCLYNSGSVVTVSATANTGYQFAGFSGSLSGQTVPQTVTMNGPRTITALFVPTAWKGVNYSPAYHSYFRMLYDWNSSNLATTVDADLASLASSGFNMVHLYIWDQATFQGFTASQPVCTDSNNNPTILCFQGMNPNEPSGFINAGGDPSQSPNGQWESLNQFVTLAENHGIFVIIDFVSAWEVGNQRALGPNPSMSAMDAVWQTYANWMNQFMQYLSGTNRHRNILAWSSYWGLSPVNGATAITTPPPPGQNFSSYSYIFAKLYQAMDTASRLYSQAPGVLGQISTNYYGFGADTSGAPSGSTMIARPPSGYNFTPSAIQQMAWTARQLLSQVYGVDSNTNPKDPDLYNLGGLYNANSFDLYNGLYELINVNLAPPNSIQIPAAKLWASEWATSSSLGPNGTGVPNVGYTTNAEEYNGYPSYGDSDTPTTTVSGQQAWIQNTLCATVAAGVQKLAYWALYDPYTLWSTPPWSKVGQDLAWNGYWGLAYEQPTLQYKGSVLQQYYQNGLLNCPGGTGSVYNATPILSLTPLSPYYTVNQPVRVMWTASDMSAMSSPGAVGTLTCDTNAQLSSSVQPASCATTDAPPSSTTGNYTVSVIAVGSNGVSQTSAQTTVSIGIAPVLDAVTIQTSGSTVYMVLWGEGFATAGNTITCIKGGTIVQFYASDGVGLAYESPTQINVNLASRLSSGTWTVSVSNGYPGTTVSNNVSVTIQ
jgi:hypothetical protein